MKLNEIVDRGDMHLHDTAAHRELSFNQRFSQAQQRTSAPAATSSGNIWLVDRATGKKLSGPFKDDDAAASFKRNRPDRIPKDARIVPL